MLGKTFGPPSLPTPLARAAEAIKVPPRHYWVVMCGEKFLEEWSNTTASIVLNIRMGPQAFRRRDQTLQGMWPELNRTESKTTLNAQNSAEETRAGHFASFYVEMFLVKNL